MAKQAELFSVNWNVAVPVEVPPGGTVPAEVTFTAPNTAGAAIVASRDESRVAVNATLKPFRRIFKGFDPPSKDVDVCEFGCPGRGHGHLLVPVPRRFLVPSVPL